MFSFENLLRSVYEKILLSRSTNYRGDYPGPKEPSKEIISAIVSIKQYNPGFCCPRIAQQINLPLGLKLGKGIMRRLLVTHCRPDPSNHGPSSLTTIGHAKDSLWGLDLFHCESILLKSHWIMAVMDQYTRRIIGFGVHAGHVDGQALCQIFNQTTSGQGGPKYLSSDNDPLFQYHRWNANLRVLDIEEIKSVPHVQVSHPFIERLIGSIQRELTDQTLLWTATTLQNKLQNYQCYFNGFWTPSGRDCATPIASAGNKVVDITTTGGRSVVAICLSYQLQPKLAFRQGHAYI